MSNKDCIDCDEVPRIARDIQDLYDTKEHYRKQNINLKEELESLKKELEQLRKERSHHE